MSPKKRNPKRAEEALKYTKLLTADRFKEALKKCGGAGTTSKIRKALGWEGVWAANGVIRNVGKKLVVSKSIRTVRHGNKVRGKFLYTLPGFTATVSSPKLKKVKSVKAKVPKAKSPESTSPVEPASVKEAEPSVESSASV